MLARVVTRIFKNVCITFVGQEPGGNVFNIALYTSPWGFVASNAEIDAILPLGSVIAIREPFLKAAGDGSIVVRRSCSAFAPPLLEPVLKIFRLASTPWPAGCRRFESTRTRASSSSTRTAICCSVASCRPVV